MPVLTRVSTLARRISSSQFGGFPAKSLSTASDKSNLLLTRLLQEPNSDIKTTLELEKNSITKSDSFFWDSLVTELKYSSPVKAQLVIEWKAEKMLKEIERDQGRYAELICLCGKVQDVSSAVQIFTSMEALGVRPTSSVFNTLITTCLLSGSISTALSLFEIMECSKDCKPNSDTYNTFISMFSKLGDGKAMQAWYLASKSVGLSPKVQTYESLIAWSVLSKQYNAANNFYDEMVLAGVTPNVAILESMLEALCKQKKLSKIQHFFKFILEGEWKLSKKMSEKLVELYSELGRVGEMEELLLCLMGLTHDPDVLSPVHCGIIRMYALSDRLDDLEFSVGRMLKQGISFAYPGDVEQIISSYFRRTTYDRLDLFVEHIQGSYKLTRSTYDLLVAGYRRVGLSMKLDLVMKDMRLAGFL